MVHFPVLRAIAESIAHVGIGALEGATGYVPSSSPLTASPADMAETLGHVIGETVRRMAGSSPTTSLLQTLGNAIDHAGLYLRSLHSSPSEVSTTPAKPSDSTPATPATPATPVS